MIDGAKSRLVRISPGKLRPSPENAQLYADNDASLNEFAERIRQQGVIEPLVITKDRFIVSGHRRHSAALRIGLAEVPCRQLTFNRRDLPTDQYVKLLREFNRQRSKTIDEILRESVVDADPDTAYVSLVESRVRRARDGHGVFEIEGVKRRAKIGRLKQPMLDAVCAAIHSRREFWPLTDRQVHYCLLSNPPLRNTNRPHSGYANDKDSWKDLCDLLTRARIAGLIPWQAITDMTRPVRLWGTALNVGLFVEKELSDLFGNYWRDLMQSQPDHYEIIIEKNASLSVIETVAMKYCIPVTSGRGQCSKEKLLQMEQRFRSSKKDRLILLLLSDFDPDGDAISNATARSLRDDFGVEDAKIVPVRVALRPDQIKKYKLPRNLEAKKTSKNYKKFLARHGVTYAVELEALAPEDLQAVLDDAIRHHLDVDAFNREVELERAEAAKLKSLKARILESVKLASV